MAVPGGAKKTDNTRAKKRASKPDGKGQILDSQTKCDPGYTGCRTWFENLGSAIIEELGGLPKQALRTITHDNGGEFARHVTVKKRIGLAAYFCDPHSPWQRGGIENANGRVRVELPRKTDLSDYSDIDIDDIVWMLNSTPRKCLGFQTPFEAFAQQLGVALEV